MGMFDSAYVKIKCPYCGDESEMECQTKELDCFLHVWRKGDFVGDETLTELSCITDCKSRKCRDYTNKEDGYVSGFGRMFYVEVKLDKGVVTGDYKILDGQ